MKTFERLLTRRFLLTVSLLLLIAWGAYAAVLLNGASVDSVAKGVDSIFKIAAVVAGTAWTLNRYFTARTDELQLRVDATVDFVLDGTGSPGMLVCRLDVVNTGKALTPPFRELVEIESAAVDNHDVVYEHMMRWPEKDLHPAPPIEPGSWSAVSFATPLRRSRRTVRVYLELRFEGGKVWTWHRHFVAAGGAKNG